MTVRYDPRPMDPLRSVPQSFYVTEADMALVFDWLSKA